MNAHEQAFWETHQPTHQPTQQETPLFAEDGALDAAMVIVGMIPVLGLLLPLVVLLMVNAG